MKRKILAVTLSLLCMAVNAFGADGDLVVNGKLGVGTTNPGAKFQVTNGTGQNFIVGGLGTGAGVTVQSWNDAYNGILPIDIRGSIISLMIGNIGIGTASPQTGLHLYGTTADNKALFYSQTTQGDGTMSGIEMTGGAANASWIIGTNRSNLGGAADNLFFYKNVGTTGSKMVIQDNGNVGIGTTNPLYTLDVAGTIRANNVSPSDIRFKKNIVPLENSLNQVMRLQGVTYDWRREEFKEKNFEEGRQIGLIAQEVEEVLPELVKTDSQGYKAVSYEKLTVVLIEALKEQQKEISQYKDKQHELEERIKRLEGAGK